MLQREIVLFSADYEGEIQPLVKILFDSGIVYRVVDHRSMVSIYNLSAKDRTIKIMIHKNDFSRAYVVMKLHGYISETQSKEDYLKAYSNDNLAYYLKISGLVIAVFAVFSLLFYLLFPG